MELFRSFTVSFCNAGWFVFQAFSNYQALLWLQRELCRCLCWGGRGAVSYHLCQLMQIMVNPFTFSLFRNEPWFNEHLILIWLWSYQVMLYFGNLVLPGGCFPVSQNPLLRGLDLFASSRWYSWDVSSVCFFWRSLRLFRSLESVCAWCKGIFLPLPKAQGFFWFCRTYEKHFSASFPL